MGLEHIETQEVTTLTGSVDFTNVFDGSADRYILFCDNFIPSGSGVTFQLSSSSITSNYSHSSHQVLSGSTFTGNGSNVTPLELVNTSLDGSTGSNHTNMTRAVFSEPENATKATKVTAIASYYDGSLGAYFGGGQTLEQSPMESFTLSFSSGDISSGIFSLYAVTEYSGSSKDHIQTIEASSQSSVDFINVFGSSDGYDRYEIEIDGLIAGSSSQRFVSRLRSDGNSTFDSGSSDYAWSVFQVGNGGTLDTGSSGDNLIRLSEIFVGTDKYSNDNGSYSIVVSNPYNSKRATVIRNDYSIYRDSASNPFQRGYTGGIRLTQSAIDSIQFLMNSGNIAEGTFSVYGIGGS